MDRQIVYPGAIPLETDLLNTNKFAMVGLAKLASAILGTHTYLQGLSCKPAMTPPMSIIIGEGQIYSLQSVDGAPYSSLAADTMTVLKQGLKVAPQSIDLEAPTTPGHSINYLVQVAYNDVDSGPAVLPYYNAANPAVAYSGPDNSGTSQKTVRTGACVVNCKPGNSAEKGAQLTPAPDTGYVAAWVITVHYGAKSIVATDIKPAPMAPFLPAGGLVAAVQEGLLSGAKATLNENEYHVSYYPPVTEPKDGQRLYFRPGSTNTGPCKLRVNELPSFPIRTTSLKELRSGVFSVNQQVEVEWNATLSTWVFCNNTEGLDLTELDQRYLSLSGGEVAGALKIEGTLSTDSALKVGKAELTTEGDILGERWKDGSEANPTYSLFKWLMQREPSRSTPKEKFVWKDPVTKLTIQGGHFNSNSGEIPFPAHFTTACFTVMITQHGTKDTSRNNPCVKSVSPKSFKIDAGKGEPAFYWLAIGY